MINQRNKKSIHTAHVAGIIKSVQIIMMPAVIMKTH